MNPTGEVKPLLQTSEPTTRPVSGGRCAFHSRAGLRARIVGCFYALLLRARGATWRKQTAGLERIDRRLASGERILFAFWHGKYVPLVVLLRGRRACVVTSRSFRGDVIAEICRWFGYESMQIPDHGGEHSLDLMRQALGDRQAAAIAVDGPLGPYHVVKRGAVQLASELGFALVPVSAAARAKRILADRWDRMEIPGLFSRVSVAIGDPIYVPSRLTAEEVQRFAQELHDALEDVDRRAEQSVMGSVSTAPEATRQD